MMALWDGAGSGEFGAVRDMSMSGVVVVTCSYDVENDTDSDVECIVDSCVYSAENDERLIRHATSGAGACW